MKCPYCQSDNLVPVTESGKTTQCCDDCGGSFEVVQEPQDDLLEDAIERNRGIHITSAHNEKFPPFSLGDSIRKFAKENDLPVIDIKAAATLEDCFPTIEEGVREYMKQGGFGLFSPTAADFFDFLYEKLPHDKYVSGDRIKVPFIGLGIEIFLKEKYKEFGYDTLVVIRGSEYSEYSCFETPKGKTLVAIVEADRMAPTDLKNLTASLAENVKHVLFTLNTSDGYEKMRG